MVRGRWFSIDANFGLADDVLHYVYSSSADESGSRTAPLGSTVYVPLSEFTVTTAFKEKQYNMKRGKGIFFHVYSSLITASNLS